MRIAVIGAGIAGLSAAWLLSPVHRITLFEQHPRAGGHADTQTVPLPSGEVAIDTGFIVLNDRNYPHLTALFEALGVRTQPSEMSFGVSIGDGEFEYGGGSLRQLFAQKRNALRPRMWRMVADLLRFYREAPALLEGASDQTVGEFLAAGGYSPGFARDHLLPMGAAIWSAPLAGITDFPARSFVQFFHNHGLLTHTNRPTWRTVGGGSAVYVQRMLREIRSRATLALGWPVAAVAREATQVVLRLATGQNQHFDAVIFACHADQALAMLLDATPAERAVLGAVRSADNVAVLHSDARFMPRRRAVWSSWNYLAADDADHAAPVSLTYWMNRLHSLDGPENLFVTLNPAHPPDDVHVTRRYRHPQFDAAAIAAQAALPAIQGTNRAWFAGAWTGWGFHEDGIASAVRIAAALGVPAPWASARAS